MLRVLFVQEVSRTIPIYQTFPIFAAILGVLFLEERLSPLLWTAVLATVAGAVLLSVRYEEPYRRLALHRSLFPLMLGSAIAGSAYVAGKIAVADLPVLYTHGVRALGLGGVLLLGSLRPATVREVRVLLREGRWAFAIVGFNEVVLASSSLILALWALSLGPVSLVTALVGTRSLFVVVYGTLLGLRFRGFLGEEVTPGSLAVKFASVALIMLGVGAIGLH